MGDTIGIPEFMQLLEGTCDQFDWTLEADESEGSERRKIQRLCLRGTLKGATPRRVFDPLGAVCYAKVGKDLGGVLADMADVLKMSDAAVSMVFAAGNDRTWSGSGDERVPVPVLESIRERLISAVGLSADFAVPGTPDRAAVLG